MKDKKHRQYRSNQGRSPEQQSNSEKAFMIATAGIIIIITILAVINV